MSDSPLSSMQVNLKGQVALVTGASQGLGRSIAIELARSGARVACVARNAEKLAETVALIKAVGGDGEAFPGDAWHWLGLRPLLHNIDALYINLLSGFELDLEVAQLIRQHFRGPIYGDLHSLMLAVQPSGLRTPPVRVAAPAPRRSGPPWAVPTPARKERAAH